jgi:hypothetical protein
MQLVRVRIGVSRLADGTAVLTPFGRLGRVYRYDPILAFRFERLMGVLLWSGVLVAALLVGAGALRRIDPRQEATTLVLCLIVLDALRVLAVKTLFRRAERLERSRPTAAAVARDRALPAAELRRRALGPLLLAETVLFAVAWEHLIAGDIDANFPFALAACHGLVYANRRLVALGEW